MDGTEAIVFDLDGVVVDSMPFHVVSWQRAFAGLGVSVDELDIYLNESATGFDVVEEMLRARGARSNTETIERLLEEQASIYSKEYLPGVKPFAGVVELLFALSERRARLGLATGSTLDVARASLEPTVFELFDAVITREDSEKGKPHPEPYLTAAKRLGSDPSRSIAVENSPAGILSATRAGFRCIALTTTLSPRHLKDADLIVGSIEELANHLLG